MALIFELTHDYCIALPAMLACGIATLFSRRYSPYSVDTLHLPEHGILLPWQVQDLRRVAVAEVMAATVHTARTGMSLKDLIALMLSTQVTDVMSTELITLTPKHSLADAALWMARRGVGRIPIVAPEDPTRLIGIVSRSDIVKAYPTEEDEAAMHQAPERG